VQGVSARRDLLVAQVSAAEGAEEEEEVVVVVAMVVVVVVVVVEEEEEFIDATGKRYRNSLSGGTRRTTTQSIEGFTGWS